MKKLFKYPLLLAFSLMFFSCGNDDQNELSTNEKSEKYTSDNIADYVSLTGISPDAHNMFRKGNGDGVNVIIFKVKIARASTNCVNGWGFCEFEWFPDFKEMKSNEPLALVDLRNFEKTENLESEKKLGYTYLYSEKKIPEDLPLELLELNVDNDLETSVKKGISAKIASGQYEFDENIGKYGGYKIPVEVNN